MRPVEWHDVEANGDAMPRRDVVSSQADVTAERAAETVGQNYHASRNFRTARQRDDLPIGRCRYSDAFAEDEIDAAADASTHGVDQSRIKRADLARETLLDEMAVPRDPNLMARRRGGDDGVGNARLGEQGQLALVELFAAKIRRVIRVRIDEDATDASVPQHGRCGRSRHSSADDGNLSPPHASPRLSTQLAC